MTDLERIHFIEETFGFKLHHVPIEKLATDFVFKVNNYSGTRNYSTDTNGNIIGLALDFSPVFLLPENYLSNFHYLSQLRLKSVFLSDYSFLKEIKGLTSLFLSNNHLSDVSFLKELKKLSSLDLSYSILIDVLHLEKLEDISFLDLSYSNLSNASILKELKCITSLNLNYCKGINDYTFLKELKNIKSLGLSGNSLSDLLFIKEFRGITSLNLSDNNLSNVLLVKEFRNITSLDLSYNNLSDVSFLKELKGITSLDLSHNKGIIDYSILKKLKAITSLNLRNNGLGDLLFLKGLQRLTSLDLSYNFLSDISFPKELKYLTSLNLRNNRLSDVLFLRELKGLTSLDLSYNRLSDVSFLYAIKNLNSLNLSYNELIKDYSFLKDLNGLSSLSLCYNRLGDVSFLKELKSLTSLFLSYNRLGDVSFLKDLKSLISLDLRDTNIKNISFLEDHKSLTFLDLRNNILTDVSFLKELKSLVFLSLSENPISTPPKEIVERGIKAIHEYFRQAEKYETEKAYEAKIMIVGEPDAGKTTLMELLFNPKHPVPSPESKQPSTLGVEVKPNRLFKNPTKDLPDIKAHIWDFGGQDIQYTLHQYFLTDDSVYILLTDGRSGKTRYGYWFHIIGLLGKNSPVLVLLNRHKDQDTVVPFDAKLYKETFPNLKILDLGEIDFGDLNHKWGNLENEFAYNLSQLPIVGQQTLKPWKPIREEIKRLTERHITLAKFNEICYRNGLEEQKDVRFLLDYLHKIGFVLNYEEETLQNTVFLDPNWITHAIYDALSDSVIIDKNGQFHKKQLYQHWQKKECDKKHVQQYTQSECNYLLNLMQKNRFEVCYPLEGKDGYYIVPLKLPNRRPEYDFETSNSLSFRYQYPFMPEGLLSRLIVRMHEYIEEGKVWLTGAYFCEDGCIAEILQHETTQEGIKYIGIRINGPELHKRQRFLRNIRREVEHIHRSTFPYIKFSEMVVCNCPVCEKQPTPNFYAYEDLQTYLEEREKEIFCTVGRQRVDIRRMIDEVFLPEDFDREGQKKPIESKPEIKRKTIKIFLASSSELSEDRKEFEIFINRKNKEYQKQGIFLELVIWEDFIDAMSATGLQDEYNKAIADCDIFVSLFHTKVGKYTNEEFDKAFGNFKDNGKPLVYTYFKDAAVNMSKITPEINTLLNFKQKLSDLGHFHTIYIDTDGLKYKFGEQLVKVMDRL